MTRPSSFRNQSWSASKPIIAPISNVVMPEAVNSYRWTLNQSLVPSRQEIKQDFWINADPKLKQ